MQPTPVVRSDAPTDPPPFPTRPTPTPGPAQRGLTNAHVIPSHPGNASGSHAIPAVARRTTPMPGIPVGEGGPLPVMSGLAPQNGPMSPTLLGTPPPPQFQTPPSSSGPAISMGIGMTKPGYASGAGMTRNDPSYANAQYGHAFEPAGSAEVQLKPNRRPLIIGAGVVLLGVIVLIAVVAGGKEQPRSQVVDPDEETAGSGSAAPQQMKQVTAPTAGSAAPTGSAAATGSGSDVIEENMVSIVIESDPQGADILIAGAKLGTTPFNQKVKRGTKVQTLTVHKEGFVDFTGKIDLSGEYENKHIKLLTPEEAAKAAEEPEPPANGSDAKPPVESNGSAATGSAAPTTGTATSGSATTSTQKSSTTKQSSTTSTSKSGTTTKSGTSKTGTSSGTPKQQKPKCQPPGPNVDPFGLPVCKS